MDFNFYIFGTPNGFDLYDGKPDDIPYFQIYDNESKENTKFIIHRRNNRQIVYSYLCYNLISYDGRREAFFGMSVIFNDIYCTDVTSLYELFEGVYKTILQSGILLKEEGGRISFFIPTFKNAIDEISRVADILHKNIKNAFAGDFKKIDVTFSKEKAYELNLSEGNNAILQAQKAYPMISVSSEYNAENKKDNIDYIDENDLISDTEIDEKKYYNINESEIRIETEQDIKDDFNRRLPFSSFFKKKIIEIIIMFIVLLTSTAGSVFIYKYYNPLKPISVECLECKGYLDKGDSFLEENKFKEALIEYRKAEEKWILNKKDDVNNAAIAFFKDNAKNEFDKNKTMQLPQIKCYEAAVEELKKTIEYAYNPNSDIDDYKRQTISYYKNEIKKTENDSEKIKYATIILTIDSNDIEAIEAIEYQMKDITASDCFIRLRYAAGELVRDWTVDDLLDRIKQSLNAGSYILAIEACNAILKKQKELPVCVTRKQLEKAKMFKIEGETMKASMNVNDVEAIKIIEKKDNCLIRFRYAPGESVKDWSVEELLDRIEKSGRGGSYNTVIEACDVIIKKQKESPNCVTREQLEKAKKLKIQGETIKLFSE
jgi:hypothetical protein